MRYTETRKKCHQRGFFTLNSAFYNRTNQCPYRRNKHSRRIVDLLACVKEVNLMHFIFVFLNSYWISLKFASAKNWFKDASSVSWYPYNRLQMLQYVLNFVKYPKWINIAKEIAKYIPNNVFLKKTKNHHNNSKKQIVYTNPCQCQDSNSAPLATPVECAAESIDCLQAF